MILPNKRPKGHSRLYKTLLFCEPNKSQNLSPKIDVVKTSKFRQDFLRLRRLCFWTTCFASLPVILATVAWGFT